MSIKNTILTKIKKEHIEPISLWSVKRKKYLIFAFFSLLIWLGVFIVSFFISDAGGVPEFVEIDTLYILLAWILVILGLGILIYRDSRNIGTLYRYSMSRVISTIFITLIVGWLLLHFSGIDIYIQKYLIKYTGYENIMSTYVYWDNPQQWRLIGELIAISPRWLIIEDRRDTLWNVALAKGVLITQSDDDYGGGMEIGKTVKISGVLGWSGTFTASGISVLFE